MFSRQEQKVVFAFVILVQGIFLLNSGRLSSSPSSRVPTPERMGTVSVESVVPATPENKTVFEEDARPEEKRNCVDINRASLSDLVTLPGIGPVLAGRILEYRKTVGRFQSEEELMAVRGIGDKTWRKLRPYITIKTSE